jgi:hypothetical protein
MYICIYTHKYVYIYVYIDICVWEGGVSQGDIGWSNEDDSMDFMG